MFIKVFRKKFSSALLLGSMVFTMINGASMYALNGKSAANGFLASDSNGAGNENVENGVAKKENKKVFVNNVDSSDSSSDMANKAMYGGAGAAAGAVSFGVAGYLGGRAKGKNDSNSGNSSNSGDGDDITCAAYDERLKKLEKKLAETKKSLEDTKEEAASSVSWADIPFGVWGLLHNREHIGKGRVITTSIIHGIFILWGIIQILFALYYNDILKIRITCSAVVKMCCPVIGLFYDLFIDPGTSLSNFIFRKKTIMMEVEKYYKEPGGSKEVSGSTLLAQQQTAPV